MTLLSLNLEDTRFSSYVNKKNEILLKMVAILMNYTFLNLSLGEQFPKYMAHKIFPQEL